MKNSTTDHSMRRRVSIDCSHPKLTDQSFKKSCDINNIVAQFKRTGLLPQTTKIPHYIDNTTTPTLEHAFSIVRTAQESFAELPAMVRRLIDNDPSKLESLISNPEYSDFLRKQGVLLSPTPQTTPTIGVELEGTGEKLPNPAESKGNPTL